MHIETKLMTSVRDNKVIVHNVHCSIKTDQVLVACIRCLPYFVPAKAYNPKIGAYKGRLFSSLGLITDFLSSCFLLLM